MENGRRDISEKRRKSSHFPVSIQFYERKTILASTDEDKKKGQLVCQMEEKNFESNLYDLKSMQATIAKKNKQSEKGNLFCKPRN